MSKKLRFKVINVCYQNAESLDAGDVDFFLEEDNWNDFGYRTTYHVHATTNVTGGKNLYLGDMNVMKKGQTIDDKLILTTQFKNNNLFFEKLPGNYCSISFSNNLYLQLNKLLTIGQRNDFVDSLRMIMDEHSDIYQTFKDEECFTTSLLRNSSMSDYTLRQGRTLLFGDTVYYDLETNPFKVYLPKNGVDFACDATVIQELSYLPSGIIAFIGHNGSGKSTILYQLAKLLFASPKQRYLLKDIIKIEPADIGISKLLMFSYSAFDNFVLPGITLSDYQILADSVNDRSGRFVFCGLRDVKQELDKYLVALRNKRIQENGTSNVDQYKDETLERFKQDRQDEDIIQKPLNVLGDEFEAALRVIFQNGNKKRLWHGMISRSEQLLQPLYYEIKNFSDGADSSSQDFQSLSTGIKFFLHALSHLIAYIESNSLVLFDEPENHLHPPLLSFMLSEFRRIIHEHHSVMLVATHSPVILQETFSNNVFVIRKSAGVVTISHPQVETYGENFGFINNMVFDLTSDIVKYYSTFDKLYDKWECRKLPTVDDMISKFTKELNCNHLSSQLTAYLISKFMNNRKV